jgi:hypothetical protein
MERVMDIFDLHGAKPKMVFGLKLQEDADHKTCTNFFTSLDGKQLSLLNRNPRKPDIPHIYVFYFQILPGFDAGFFIRKLHRSTAALVCMIQTGGYFIETSHLVIQHRYASSEADDSNQGFAHVLEIVNAPANKPSFLLHGFEHGKGHQIFESRSLEKTISLYETMLRFGFPALKGNTNVSHSYEVIRGQPWFYAR